MADAYRHHHAVKIVLVPVPCGGSPAPLRPAKPLPFRRDPQTHWRPATRQPSKAAATLALVRRMVEQEAAVREMMLPRPPGLGA
ncbi:MAG TPA: hypothetical protein VFE60_05145 [Roseiarcus sp.]|jgi:hypothetical protein|nr:hypothetical protein [Roseiarcus sp.]